MTDATKETVFQLLREYGFATLVACFLGYVGRQDVILPMVESHREFLKDIAETQREISQAVGEQTRLLYALQPRLVNDNKPDPTRN
jgi:hypothetical protein